MNDVKSLSHSKWRCKYHILNAEYLSTEQVLKARGLMKIMEGRDKMTNTAVLLSAENIIQVLS